MIVVFVDLDGIVDYHCFNFLKYGIASIYRFDLT